MKFIILKTPLIIQTSTILKTIFLIKTQTSIFLLQPSIFKHSKNRLLKAFFTAWCKHSLLSMWSCKMCLCTHNFSNWLPKTFLPFLSERDEKTRNSFFLFTENLTKKNWQTKIVHHSPFYFLIFWKMYVYVPNLMFMVHTVSSMK